jgi:F0F1-type ATP synthase membrane subunit b/b'
LEEAPAEGKGEKGLEEALEEARRKADQLIEEALRRGSELAEKVEEMRRSGDPEKERKAQLFLEGKAGIDELGEDQA